MESNKENWTEIHEDFNEYYKNLWKNHGFDCQAAKEWKEILGENFKVSDWSFCVWIRDEKHLTSQEVKQSNLEDLKKEYNKLWTDAQKDFTEKYEDEYDDECEDKTYQQIWEENGFTYEEAKKWIRAGFKPQDSKKVKEWKNREFTLQEAQKWTELGFNSYHDISKACSWKDQGFNVWQTKEWIQAGFELDDYYKAKEWRDQDFTAQEAWQWTEAGFDGYDDHQTAKKWKTQSFAPQQSQEWLKLGLNKHGANFAKFLLTRRYSLESFPNNKQLEKLKKDYARGTNDWSVIDKEFVRYQQKWEEELTSEEAWEWTSTGLKPSDYLDAKRWKQEGFSPEETKNWFELGLEMDDYDLASWLIKEKNPLLKNIQQEEIKKLKDEYFSLWETIDREFGKGKGHDWKQWKRLGFTMEEVREWIQAGWKPEDYSKAQEWRQQNFTDQETWEWFQTGLMKDEIEFALYLKQKGYTPDTVDKQALRNQTWLDWKYPPETREEIKELSLYNEGLEGSLNLNDFVNLEELNCASNWKLERIKDSEGSNFLASGMDSLDIGNCENLVSLDCSLNAILTTLILPKKGEKLKKVSTSCYYNSGASNNLADLSIFEHLVNLEELDLYYNVSFTGSLEPLKKLTKLKHLDIYKTGLDSGLEYLPDSLEYFNCKETKLEEIWDFSWSTQENNDDNSRIRRWKAVLPKKQEVAHLIFNFWKLKKNYQQLEQEKNQKKAQLQILQTKPQLTFCEKQKISQLEQELTNLNQKLKLEASIKKQLQEILTYTLIEKDKVKTLQKENAELKQELKSTQDNFKRFLEAYIIEKREQIGKEQNHNKLEVLQEELKVLESLQSEQVAQIQQTYPFKQ